MAETGRDGVVLLHGILRRAASMRRLEHKLAAEGYSVLNLDYPSRRESLSDIVDGLHDRIAAFEAGLGGQLHFVTHSMGGLVARAYLNRFRPRRLGRVVMLTPPNEGSEIADLLRRNWFYRVAFGPAGDQLATQRSEELCELLGTVDYPLGVVAGDRSLYIFASLVLPGPNDGRVSVERTRVAGMSDHIVLHSSHPLIMRDPEAIAQTIHFLRNGAFRR
ncbi:Alpha/beta fold hydrolase [Hyphomicrobiales bacterium]|nr:Alpha/beta fold hydrolase [Hyphomicrobiales bacterium]CAH1700239.1 Alpha/beta fold hydrolase [Hyphomicrobiales bacterium]CAI0344017.1 triacylglycerol lipase [Hyphomicrobiales bacterium]